MLTYRKVLGERVAPVAKSLAMSTTWIGMGTVSRQVMREPRNRIFAHKPDPHPPTIRKVPSDSVPYGESISLNGKHVWAAYDGDTLVAVAPTAGEARLKYQQRQTR